MITQISIAASKATIKTAGEMYDQATQRWQKIYKVELRESLRQILATIYNILVRFIEGRDRAAEKRYIEKWHGTILCTCHDCDKERLWSRKDLRELKKSWM